MEDPAAVRFEQSVLPHMDAAYNLARWLVRQDQDAQDIVQDAYLRAWRAFAQFRGEDSRSWLLTIVRNTCYSWLKKNRRHEALSLSDEHAPEIPSSASDAQATFFLKLDQQVVRDAIENLPVEFREVVVMRELEEMSYKEIADVTGTPVGTVMSRLSRGRQRLAGSLGSHVSGDMK